MASKIFYGQKILFAVGCFQKELKCGNLILAYEGEGVKIDCEESTSMDDIFYSSLQDIPEIPGLYIWEGSLEVNRNGIGENEINTRYIGVIRIAKISDLQYFHSNFITENKTGIRFI